MRKRIGATLALAALIGWFQAVLGVQAAAGEDGGQAAEGDDSAPAPKKSKAKAAKRGKKSRSDEAGEPDEELAAGTVGLFDAVKKKQLSVQFVAQNSAVAALTIINPSSQAVTVQIPTVIAGAPAVPAGTTEQAFFQTFGTAPPPTVGGVISRLGPNTAVPEGKEAKKKPSSRSSAKPAASADNVLTLPPAGTQVLAVVCVCLDFGKPDPLPTFPYKLVPIDNATKRPEVKALLNTFAKGKLDRNAAQLAAWHFNNGMSWEQLQQLVNAGTFPANAKLLEDAKKVSTQVEKDVKAEAKEKAKEDKEKDEEPGKKPAAGKNKDAAKNKDTRPADENP